MFDKQYQTYFGHCYKVASLFTKDRDAIKDIIQNAWIDLWKKYGDSFIHVNIVKQAVYWAGCDFVQKESRQYHFKERSVYTEIDLEIDIAKFISKQDKEILDMYIEGFTQQEIGDKYGMSRQNVSLKLIRIKKQIKKLL